MEFTKDEMEFLRRLIDSYLEMLEMKLESKDLYPTEVLSEIILISRFLGKIGLETPKKIEELIGKVLDEVSD